MLSVAEAQAGVLKDAVALPPENAALNDAHGRVLAADLAALRTQPPAAVSAMDGPSVAALFKQNIRALATSRSSPMWKVISPSRM